MGAPAQMGFAMTRYPCRVLAAIVLLLGLRGSTAAAAERYALIVSGATGGEEYALKYKSWRVSLTILLSEVYGYPDDHIIALAEEKDAEVKTPTRENIRAALVDLQRRAKSDDLVFVLLLGHGTAGAGEEAKFNLVGPDLSAEEWASLIAPISARLVFVNAASGSFPFLQRVSGRGRIVITATASAAQEYETVFPEFFLKALGDPPADADKNGRVSIWEAFNAAAAGLRKWYDDRGLMATERPLLDDTGDGLGREADDPKGTDGAIAQVTFLQPDTPIAAPAGSELGTLLRRRADMQAQVDLLRARKLNLPENEYQAELERLLLELARLDREIRARSAP
jgi:hypothetical protein